MRNLVHRLLRRGRRSDEGASAVEYGLLVALIAVVIAFGVAALGKAVGGAVEQACKDVGTTDSDCSKANDNGTPD